MAIIGVVGSGTEEWPELAAPLGCIWIADNGYDLLTGAGQNGPRKEAVRIGARKAGKRTNSSREDRLRYALPTLPLALIHAHSGRLRSGNRRDDGTLQDGHKAEISADGPSRCGARKR